MAEIKRLGEIRFVLDDERSMEGNESIDCTYALYGDEGDEILSIEDYYYKCKYFAAAMGYTEKTINDWFGRY